MITQSSIRYLLEKIQTLEKQTLVHKQEISFDLFSTWRAHRRKIGKYIADETLCYIARKYNAYILSNPVYPFSYAHFTRSDVQSKNFSVKERTLRDGISSGFLKSKSSIFRIKSLDFWIQQQRFYAVQRNNKECLVKKAIYSDIPLKVSCYEDNSFIISDIDLVSIALHNSSNKLLFDVRYGELTMEELIIIQDINQYFQKLIARYFAFEISEFRLIAHGPANRFSKSKISHLHYPMQVYTPAGSMELLGHEMDTNSSDKFFGFNRKLDSLGYCTYLNPTWKF